LISPKQASPPALKGAPIPGIAAVTGSRVIGPEGGRMEPRVVFRPVDDFVLSPAKIPIPPLSGKWGESAEFFRAENAIGGGFPGTGAWNIAPPPAGMDEIFSAAKSWIGKTAAPLFFAGVLFLQPGGASRLHAADITVAGPCTLDEAITAANTDLPTTNCPAGSGADTLFLDGTITLSGELPRVTSDIVFQGTGPTTTIVDGDGAYRVFFLGDNANTPTVAFQDLTIQNGYAKGGDGQYSGGGGAGLGGGLFVYNANVAARNVVFSGNRAIGGAGGPIASFGGGGGGGMGGNGGYGAGGGGGGGGLLSSALGGDGGTYGNNGVDGLYGGGAGGGGDGASAPGGLGGTAAFPGGDGGDGGDFSFTSTNGSPGGFGGGGGGGGGEYGVNPGPGGFGGAGGFGGGGGGGGTHLSLGGNGGDGGFGGGGGAGNYNGGLGGNGGFGGGGGGGACCPYSPGNGGYGGGNGANGYGGGGAGLGGAIFAMQGTLLLEQVSFGGNEAILGTSFANVGSADGGSIFICDNLMDPLCGAAVDINSCEVAFVSNLPNDSNVGLGILPVCNVPPIANPVTSDSLEDENATITLDGADPDNGPMTPVSYTIASLPAAGSLYTTTDGVTLGPEIISAPQLVTNQVIFVPGLNEFGLNYGDFNYFVSDGLADSPEATVTVNVIPVNDLPAITSIAPATATEDVEYQYQVVADDPDDTVFTYALFGEPAGMSISTTGLVTWTPPEGVTAAGPVTVTVFDPDLAFGEEIFSISVSPVNDPPVITSTAPATAFEDVEYQYQVFVDDPDDTVFTYSLLDQPAGMAISATGLVTWTPPVGTTAAGPVTVTVEDPNLDSDTEVFSLSVSAGSAPPVISGLDGDTVVYSGIPVALDAGSDATVTDADSPDLDGGYLWVQPSGGGAFDQLFIDPDADGDANSGTGIFSDGSGVFWNGNLIGAVDAAPNDGIDGNALGVLLNGTSITPASAGALIQAIRYESTDTAPSPITKSFGFTVSDGFSDSATVFSSVDVNLSATFFLTVSVSGSGSVSGPGIACPTDCEEALPDGETVSLLASPGSGYVFSGWSGDASGNENPLSFTLLDDAAVTAIFSVFSPPPPIDQCPSDPAKLVPGICGCGVPDVDLNDNGVIDCLEPADQCPGDPDKTEPGECGCGVPDEDLNENGIIDCLEPTDQCPDDPDKTEPGECGCGVPDEDLNDNGVIDCLEPADQCPDDPDKTEPGECGCGVPDVDLNENGIIDCLEPADQCPDDPNKIEPGICGCGVPDVDSNQNGIIDCQEPVDFCPNDPLKTEPGDCGCGVPDEDRNQNGITDCLEPADFCPEDPDKIEPGLCGCGVVDADRNGNGVIDCQENQPPNPPEPLEPADGTVFPSGPIQLVLDEFSDPEGDGHAKTRWEIRAAGPGCNPPFIVHVSANDLNSYTVDPDLLPPGLAFEWRGGYFDDGGARVSWSPWQSFVFGNSRVNAPLSIPAGAAQSDYQMIGLSVWPEELSPEAFLRDALGRAYDQRFFRIGQFDPETGAYVEFGPDFVFEPGLSFWVLARNGLVIPNRGVAASGARAFDHPLAFGPSGGFNMIASPNGQSYVWDDLEIVLGDCSTFRIGDLPADNPHIDLRLWEWTGQGYDPNATLLEGRTGYWARVKQSGLFLRFPAPGGLFPRAPVPGDGASAGTARSGLRRSAATLAAANDGVSPPMPPGALASTTDDSSGGGGGACFLGVMGGE
jgi:hypothetical protein